MSHRDKEKVIKELRTIRAAKKELMGLDGKLAFICKYLGSVISRQGSAYMDVDFLEDPYDVDHYDASYEQTMGEGNIGPMTDPGKLLDYDGGFISEEGLLFDGLKWGMHLEITHNFLDKKIAATFKGYRVYEEIAGDLQCYVPIDEWEDMVDRLYKVAKDRKKKNEPIRAAELELKIQEKKKGFFQKLMERWGI